MAKKNASLSRPLVNVIANPGSNQDSTKKVTNTGQKPADKTTPPPPASKQK
jgi:hypothetical protein